jgi:DNA modification methylase
VSNPATVADLQPLSEAENPRKHTPRNIDMIETAIGEVGLARSIVIDEAGKVWAGNGTVEAALNKGINKLKVVDAEGDEVVAVRRKNLSPSQKVKLALYDNRAQEVGGGWNDDVLASIRADGIDLAPFFTQDELSRLLANGAADEETARTLAERFIVPPFSVLDARQGYWQTRKRAWLALGIESEIGRKENLLKHNLKLGMEDQSSSIFDPVLCELAYRWFCPEHGQVLDPFAGGSVRGIVATRLGRQYFGIELRKEQVVANDKQRDKIVPKSGGLFWKVGDARDIDKILPKDFRCDFMFTCPPYFNLEVYSDDTRDLSTLKDYDNFLSAYERIITRAVARLKPNRFACIVVGDVRAGRGKGEGFYRLLPAHTISAFEQAGAKLYNEAILITAVGTLAVRVSTMFEAGRKLGPSHQHVFIFCKGNPSLAVKALGPAEFGNTDAAIEGGGVD